MRPVLIRIRLLPSASGLRLMKKWKQRFEEDDDFARTVMAVIVGGTGILLLAAAWIAKYFYF
jgi:hypothetical protein